MWRKVQKKQRQGFNVIFEANCVFVKPKNRNKSSICLPRNEIGSGRNLQSYLKSNHNGHLSVVKSLQANEEDENEEGENSG